MTDYRKLLSFIFLLLSGLFNIYSQEQSDFLDILSEKLNEYCRLFPREEIYVHTDRTEYIAGEDLWYRIYLFDRQTERLSCESSIAYFEILNPDNRPVVRKRIKLVNGSGPGQVTLPDTISSGYYTIRTYTNWMRNFMPENCFSKTILIYNALNAKTFRNKHFTDAIAVKDSQGDTLSALQRTGLTVTYKKNLPENVDLIIRTDRNFRTANLNKCYIFIQTHGIINYKSVVNLQADSIKILIPGNQLTPGINQVTIFSFSGRPLYETCLYTPVNPTEPLKIISDNSYHPREKITLGLEYQNVEYKKSDLQSYLSISVALAGNEFFPGIADYMIFGSEFGIIPEEIFKTGIDNIPEMRLKKILSGLKSNWIDWNVILGGKYPDIKYERESQYHYLYGRLLNRNTQIPDKDRYVFLSVPGKNAVFQYAKTDENGDFCFALKVDDNLLDLIIQPEEIDRNNNIRIETSFSEKYIMAQDTVKTESEEIPENISRLAVNYQVMKIYDSDDLPEESSAPDFTRGVRRFYGKPDIELVMDDYIRLPVMQEVFFELMPGVIMKKVKSEYEITMADPVNNRIYNEPPVLFIDGVIIKDPATIAELDPEKVEKIDAIRSRYFVGDYMFYGLVNIITREGDYSDVVLPDYAVRLPYRITDPSGTFIFSDYSSPEKIKSRIPDFRNTLIWKPLISDFMSGKTSVEFFAPDSKADYEISIQGILSDGKLISVNKIIKIN